MKKEKPKPDQQPPSRWKTVRQLFRWCRILVLFVSFLFIFAAIYFNAVGLPEFLKRPLLARLREQGWEVQFTEMHWHWYRGVVINDASFRRTNDTVKFSAREADLNIDLGALRKSGLKLQALILQDADVTYVLSSNRPPLSLKQLNTKVYLRGGDQLQLASFAAHFGNAKLNIKGTLAHASELMPWKISEKPASRPVVGKPKTADIVRGESMPEKVEKLLDLLSHFDFTETPEINATIHGDARDWKSWNGVLKISAPATDSSWGKFKHVHLDAELNSENKHPLDLHLTAQWAEGRWGIGENVDARIKLQPNATNASLMETELHILAKQLVASGMGEKWNFAVNGKTQFDGRVTHALTNFILLKATGKVRLANGSLHFAEATNEFSAALPEGEVRFTFLPSVTNVVLSSVETSAWKKLAPWTFGWTADLQDVKARGVEIQKLRCRGDWRAPEVNLKQLDAELYGGTFSASGSLNVNSRKVQTIVSSDFDLHQIASLLPGATQNWLTKMTWKSPPKAEGEVICTLPETWFGVPPSGGNDAKQAKKGTLSQQAFLPARHERGEGRGEGHSIKGTSSPQPSREGGNNLQPPEGGTSNLNLQISANVAMDDFTFYEIPARFLQAQLQYSNHVWTLPNAHLAFPQSEAKLSLVSDDQAGTFQSRIQGQLDPKIIRPFLAKDQQSMLDLYQAEAPMTINGEIRGAWKSPSTIGFTGDVLATNCSFRNLYLDHFSAALEYTNLFLSCSDVQVRQGLRKLDSPKIEVSFQTNRAFFTDVRSTMDPFEVTRAIGDDIYEAIAPYQFAEPPFVILNGSVSLVNAEEADMHFDVKGGKFRWGILHTDTAAGRVDWVNGTLVITNAIASAYDGGSLAGWGFVKFLRKGADYRLQGIFTNVNVQALVATLQQTNGVEGWLEGKLNVTSASTDGLHTWQGDGEARLRDGLIWEIPVFGIFSPVLNAIVPGLGKNRASSASATAVITNGVARSENLEIRASAVRLQYRGTLDYEGKVDARVEAELLRDTWVIGRLVSLALTPISKIFEYKVTGPANNPKMEPVYIPKFLLMTLRPFHTLKNLLPEKASEKAPDSNLPAPEKLQ